MESLSPGHTAYDTERYSIHVSGHTVTGTIRSEQFNRQTIFLVSLSYRYRMQCDRGLKSHTFVSGITSYMWLQRPSETDMKANPAGTQSIRTQSISSYK